MRAVLVVGLALLLITVESVLVKYLGLSVTRIDVSVAVIAFLALRAAPVQGAVASFSIGYLLDVMSGRPTGLYTFLAVLVFLGGRMVSSLVDVRTTLSFALFAMAADTLHGLTGVLLSSLTAREGGTALALLAVVPGQVVLTGLAAFVLHPLLRRIDPGGDRPEVGVLR